MYDLLISLGLSDKEANLYLAVLELGKASVQQLSEQSGMKRVTAYVILEQLLEVGLIKQMTEGKKKLYHAAHPSTLEKLLEGRISQLEAQRADLKGRMDQLEAMYNFRTDKPTVRYFEGKDGLEELDRYGRGQLTEGMEVLGISPHDLIAQAFPKRRTEAVNERLEKKITSKVIYVDDAETSEAANKKQLREGIHFSRKELDLKGTCVVYTGWGVKFFSYDPKDYFGVLIQSPEIADILEKVFSLAWDGAKMRKK